MLMLYVKTGCPYCAAVLHKVEELGIEVEQKNIADDTIARELIDRGGKRQVPYLVDTERNVEMYESGDINDYLAIHYGNKVETEKEKNEKKDESTPQVCTLE